MRAAHASAMLYDLLAALRLARSCFIRIRLRSASDTRTVFSEQCGMWFAKYLDSVPSHSLHMDIRLDMCVVLHCAVACDA